MAKAEEIGDARKKWRERKDACVNAGAPKNLFGTDDLGPALDKMQECVTIVERGSKVAQDAEGKKALDKAKTDGRAAANRVNTAATRYRERAENALQKATSPGLKTALRDTVTALTRCQTIASGVAKML